jgi:hypothetical protein
MADRKNRLGPSVAIGAGIGAALGVALHRLSIWLLIGCAAGLLIGVILSRMQRHLCASENIVVMGKALAQ